MKPDPAFPDRPTHPDFKRLSEAVIANDNEIEGWSTADDGAAAYLATLARLMDPDSLRYMASQRAGLAVQAQRGRIDEPLLSATWIDGFMAAARMLSLAVKDGQHR